MPSNGSRSLSGAISNSAGTGLAPKAKTVTLNSKFVILLLLMIGSVLGNIAQVPLFQSISFLFGSVFALIAARIFGFWPAIMVAGTGSIVTIFAWGHPWAAIGLILEAGFAALMMRRADNMVIAVVAYWVFCGFWLILVSYALLVGLPWESAGFVALKQAINGVLNAVLAGLALAALRMGSSRFIGLIPRTSIKSLLFYLVSLATILSVTVMVVAESRSQYSFARLQLKAAMEVVASWAVYEMTTEETMESQRNAFETGLSGSRLMDGTIPVSIDDFHVSVTDRDGQVRMISGIMRSNMDSRSIVPLADGIGLWQPDGDMPEMARYRQSYYVWERPFSDGGDISKITVEFNAAPIISWLEERSRWDMTLLGVTSCLALLVTYFVLGWLMAPLRRLEELSSGMDEAVRSGQCVSWLSETGVREYDTLSATLDTASRALVVGFNERKALAESLEEGVKERTEQLDFLSQIVRQTTNAVVVTDVAGKVTWVNEAFEQLSGYDLDMALGQKPGSFLQKVPPADDVRKKMQEGLARADGFAVELLNHRRDDRPYWVEIRCGPMYDQEGRHTGFIAIQNDVTLRHEFELRLRQTQKLEAVGHLTSGLAHDFNNLLTVIIGCADLLGPELDDRPELRRLVDMSLSAAEHGSQLTKSLLAYSRRQPLEPKNVALDAVTANFLPLLRQSVGEKISVATVSTEKTWRAKIDVSQYESALLNLAVNARDAMPDGGSLSIRITNVQVDENDPRDRSDVEPGRYICVDVVDTGQGMTPEVLDHVFEPFYTTKRDLNRSGLGLSMIFGFVAQSGGFVRILSEVGKGTRVQMFFPVAEDAVVEPA